MTTAAPKPHNKDNDVLRFPFPQAPAPGTLADVSPGVQWLRMPLPFALNHINLWVLDDGDGWTLVDTGINTAATRDIWTEILGGPLKSKPVKRLICTHFHPDHIGLAGWLVDRLGIPLWITPREWETAQQAHAMTVEESARQTSDFYVRAGYRSVLSDAMDMRSNSYTQKVHALPDVASMIDPGKSIESGGQTWRVVVGEGHSPQLAALHAARPGVLISGDQVLPGISPNVSVRTANADVDRDHNPLKQFLDSLARFRDLPADTLVLPSHKLPFYGVRERVDQLIAHHRDRLDIARRACVTGVTARDVLVALFQRDFDAHQLHFALGETVAHLNYLICSGEIVREDTPQGVDRYRTLSSPAAAA